MQLADLDMNSVYTYADYYNWKFPEIVELINGRVFKMNPITYTCHQALAGDIHTLLNVFLRKKTCKTYAAPFDVRLPRKSKDDKDIFTVLQPDICVICDLTKIDKRGCIGAPDIVVEVLSPGNNAKELKNKYEMYEEAGVKEYWIVSPQNQSFLVHTLVDGKFVLSPLKTVGDEVTSSVLPGFSIDLTELFNSADPTED